MLTCNVMCHYQSLDIPPQYGTSTLKEDNPLSSNVKITLSTPHLLLTLSLSFLYYLHSINSVNRVAANFSIFNIVRCWLTGVHGIIIICFYISLPL